MSSRFQLSLLSHSISYPNSVAWSEENLVAVACSSIVLIMNPAKPSQSRGVVSIPPSKPFPIGVIEGAGESLISDYLLPCNLSRDTRQHVRSLSWSPVGLANNAGCLLAVCTSEGRVKLYRFPYCEFFAEWIEIADISELQFNYYTSINFEESQMVRCQSLTVIPNQDNASHESIDDPRTSSLIKEGKRRKKSTPKIAADESNNLKDNSTWQIVPVSVPVAEVNLRKKVVEDCNIPVITAQQYVSRSAMLASLTVAWSPILRTSGDDPAIPHNACSYCAVLAVGGKCGRISFWRILAPECYSIVNPSYLGKVVLVGHFKAHDTWVTAIDWAGCASGASEPKLLLATGSSDGRVKIWLMNVDELLNSSEPGPTSCSLLKEVLTVGSATVSVISMAVPSHFPWKVIMAIGKGSGSFEVGFFDVLTRKYENVGSYNAHNLIVTGLAWAFDGHCLYSCSQDNSVKSWKVVGNSLCEVPFPSNSPNLESCQDVPYVFDSCFGLAVSPGNLAIAVVRRIDTNLLNPMYEGRIHKAAAEFLWIGGQQLDNSFVEFQAIDTELFPGLPEKELICWGSNILWSLNMYEDLNRLLNLWDIIASLLAFKHSASKHVVHIVLKWLSSFFGCQSSISTTFLCEASKILPKLSSRQLHLVNLICRHVILGKYEADNICNQQQEVDTQEDKAEFWMQLLLSSENELRERLVGITFSAILSPLCNLSVDVSGVGCWNPDGLLQMVQWVSLNEANLKDHSRFLATEVQNVDRRRLEDIIEYGADEQCSICSASVPFESTEYAICSGRECHKMRRCPVTMRLSSLKCSWFCKSCRRTASKLPPRILFTMRSYPSDFMSFLQSSLYKESSTPCCPFCGILLVRLQPEYFLSPSSV